MRSGVMLSITKAPVSGFPDFPKYPFYMGKYQILDLMKLQFTRIAKDYRREFAGLMTRPKVEFHESYRFDRNITNREFRRRWYRNHRGRFIASDHKRYLVLTARPGPGPLVKAAKYLSRHASYEARRAIKRENRSKPVGRSRAPKGPDGLPMVFEPTISKYIVPQRRLQDEVPRKRHGAPFEGAQIIREGDRRVGVTAHYDPKYNRYWISLPGGRTRPSFENYFSTPPPKSEWKKYNYFYRKFGRWRPSEHHPYEDEDIVMEQWLKGQLSPIAKL